MKVPTPLEGPSRFSFTGIGCCGGDGYRGPGLLKHPKLKSLKKEEEQGGACCLANRCCRSSLILPKPQELGIDPPQGHELFMIPLLNDSALVHHEDPVRIPNG